MEEAMLDRLIAALFAELDRQGPYVGALRALYEPVVLDGEFNLHQAVIAILRAMREPTEAMVSAGTESLDTCLNVDPCGKASKHMWCDMIGAALAEQPA